LIGFFAKFLILLSLSLLIGFIPVNRSFTPDQDGIDIYIASNGVHTDFVFPVQTSIKDWRTLFCDDHFKDGWIYAPYIAFGWGDKGFYLNTPEWKDLKLRTALNALLIPSTSAMHVSLWSNPVEDDLTIRIRVSEKEYESLVDFIMNSFQWDSDHRVTKIEHPGYGDFDLFFESSLKFHLFRTCNVWTNQGLKKAGIRTALWTPYDRPILYHLSGNVAIQ
jgi:uncharacterized protein (TIGR02117 family)